MSFVRGGRGAAREVAFLGEHDAEAAPGRVARNAAAVDAAAHDEEIAVDLAHARPSRYATC